MNLIHGSGRYLATIFPLVLAACSASPISSEAEGSQENALTARPCAAYPIPMAVDAKAEQRARDALRALSQTAALEWSGVRGTVSEITGLGAKLACADGDPLGQSLWGFIEQSPALFQIDRAEWQLGERTCDSVQGIELVKLLRTRVGGLPVAQDTVTFVLKRVDGAVVLDSVNAVYLPQASAATKAALASCPQRPARELERAAQSQRYTFVYYAQLPAPSCTFAGTGHYSFRAPDAIELDSEPMLEWSEQPTGVELRKTRNATIRVASSHASERIRSSDANCVDGATDRIGFRARIDAVTGKVIDTWAGSEPYCVVCLAGAKQ